ncbi:ATP-dependent DNA ligase [Glutamicibacter mishrai]|uniref:ATP-dependent DNA ligase n=1 Tax=Glutamicibacter mishrai TaxID=1775880 RepID=UPI0020CC40AA|nr:ATP-dependent DNA ligase [Glutamicibacter mishrai]UTT39408.1 ATP-dependent DNA ligase [Glutamicibacter mishrai]
MARKEQTAKVAGHELKVSNLDKILYPQTGTTKGEVMDYFQQAAPALLPHAAWRPATRKRWVDGVGTDEAPGKAFFRKDLEDSAPSWIPRARLRHKTHSNTYPLVNDEAVLAWIAQVAALEVHVPQWRFDSALEPSNPDRLVLDLDPGPGAGLEQCAEVALICREILEGMDLRSFPVTSGSKGIHLYAGLDGKYSSDQISEVAKELAASLQRDHPQLVVASMKRSLRENKVLVDWSQNNAAKTTVCPYSLRGRSRPTVAAPRTWREIEASGLRQLEFQDVLDRLEDGIDPLAPLAALGAPGQEPDRLAAYRSKRDASQTPEPVPGQSAQLGQAAGSQKGSAPGFVIQEHHARRLHWDFRLEHEGVLASWAVPKGPPMETGVQRLAVMTEDHPLSYASFEGRIPKGQYGAGEVSIWDTGTCTIEKWREGKEAIAILQGKPSGGLGGIPRRFVLIHAPSMGGKDNWLLQLAKDQPAADSASGPPEPDHRKPTEDLSLRPPRPMLAANGTATDISSTQGWSFEMKWDGYRAIGAVQDGVLSLLSRNGHELTAVFPDLAELGSLLPDRSVLDGEIVALDEAGRPDFSLLERYVAAMRKKRTWQARAISIQYLLFDALQLPSASGEPEDLTALPYAERRRRLESMDLDHSRAKIPPAYDGTVADAVQISQELGLEGIVAKECASPYEPGQRSGSWIKLKHEIHQEAIVIGWREGSGARASSFASLLLAVPGREGLSYAGRVGTGFSDAQLAEISSRLEKLQRKTPAAKDVPASHQKDARWVSPKLVGEVRCSEVTSAGLLRHPVWRGWRDDKDPQEVRWEPKDPALAENRKN